MVFKSNDSRSRSIYAIETEIIKLFYSRAGTPVQSHQVIDVIRIDNINALNLVYKIPQVRYLIVEVGVFPIILTAFDTVFFL